jgi:hypothetical protein
VATFISTSTTNPPFLDVDKYRDSFFWITAGVFNLVASNDLVSGPKEVELESIQSQVVERRHWTSQQNASGSSASSESG